MRLTSLSQTAYVRYNRRRPLPTEPDPLRLCALRRLALTQYPFSPIKMKFITKVYRASFLLVAGPP